VYIALKCAFQEKYKGNTSSKASILPHFKVLTELEIVANQKNIVHGLEVLHDTKTPNFIHHSSSTHSSGENRFSSSLIFKKLSISSMHSPTATNR